MLLKVIEQSIVYWAIVLLLTAQPIKSQQVEFPVGVFTNLLPDDFINHHYPSQDHDKIKAMGVNSVIQFITQENRIQLQRYDNVIGLNTHFEDDYIARYASGYYSRWQAEENISLSVNYPGVKHEFGSLGTDEWRSGTEPENIGKYLVTGPDYYQNRTHRFWPWGGNPIFYKAKFRMKIDGNAFGDEPVCKLEVVYYAPNGNHAVLEETTLTATDLSNTYEDIILNYTIPQTIGSYTFVDPPASPEGGNLPGSNSEYTGRQGVRFNVVWLGNRELFVDFIEVYDDQIGIDFLPDNRQTVATNCSTYAANYPHSQWPNLKYWYGLDELQTIDNFEPYRIVDSILNANGFPRLITTYYPEWDGLRDNEIDLKRFVLQAQPERVQYYYYPYNSTNSVSEMLEYQRYVMQQPWQHNFNIGDWYFVAQAFGYNPPGPAYNNWRKPTREEMRATVNLAIAHGAKGMYFWNYYSYWTNENQDTLLDAIVDINETPTELYHEIRDNIAPRLKGKFGSTLLGLNYTGNYLNFSGGSSEGTVHTKDYLSIWQGNQHVFYHSGLLEDKNDGNNKYFLIINELTDSGSGDRTANIFINLNHTLSGYQNWCVRNVEENFDTTFLVNSHLNFQQMLSAGDGKLFRVSPVIKYGGTLVGNDTITSNISLQDNMTIYNNVTLFVKNSVYTIADTITLQGTGFISGDGYVNIASSGRIIINSFSRSLFKGKVGVYPKLIWHYPPELSSVQHFNIYRRKGSTTFVQIATVNGNVFQYVDSTTEIITVPQANETFAEYYIEADGLEEEEIPTTLQSNTIRYQKVEGLPQEKQQAGDDTKVFKYELSNNYPNPFNPTTIIKYEIANEGMVTLKVYDLLGKEVKTLVKEKKQAGVYEAEFNASTLPSGIYFYKLIAGNFSATKKLIVMK